MESFVTAKLNYGANKSDAEILLYDPPPGRARMTLEQAPCEVRILNGREAGPFSIDREGFQLVSSPIDTPYDAPVEAVQRDFYPQVERLVRSHLGARRVLVFDHDFRGRDVTQVTDHLREPVLSVHNDYTTVSAPQRVRDLLPDEAEGLLARRYAFVNFWKPVGHAAENTPLAMCDARSLSERDLILVHLRYKDRDGQVYGVRHSPAHRWFYFPDMQLGEALLLKVFDSDAGRARFSAHSAFVDPSSRPGTPPRQSIEVRTIAFF